ncbi:hypothetical protein AYI69_g6624 [Smittium culicis]|uniref:SGNH hydrolase-type esterase domain-containing protein n=1 Tax=Smittium culicis TaxID=133412 RepID=A0A1R1XXM0_9FUNG|nr:hypothetical protein AYI69_g6624 [Smittium culicis]
MFPKSRDDEGGERIKFPSCEKYESADKFNLRADLEIGSSSTNKSRTKMVIIFLGANDASLPVITPHIPLKEFEVNILKMVDLLTDPSPDRYSPQYSSIAHFASFDFRINVGCNSS